MIGLNAPAVVVWIAPDGRQLHLAGGADQRRERVSLDVGLGGVGGMDASAKFTAGVNQFGETLTGFDYAHGEVDLPLSVLADSVADMQATREAVKGMFSRDKAGWLAVYTPVTGWRWLRCYLKTMKAAVGSSPYLATRATIQVVLLAEDPRASVAGHSSLWRNETLSGHGELWAYNAGEFDSWPSFVVHGPGAVTLAVRGSTITLPRLDAGERCLLHADPMRGVLRSVGADGVRRNRWPDVTGYLAEPLPAGELSSVVVTVAGGDADTAVLATVDAYTEGLL